MQWSVYTWTCYKEHWSLKLSMQICLHPHNLGNTHWRALVKIHRKCPVAHSEKVWCVSYLVLGIPSHHTGPPVRNLESLYETGILCGGWFPWLATLTFSYSPVDGHWGSLSWKPTRLLLQLSSQLLCVLHAACLTPRDLYKIILFGNQAKAEGRLPCMNCFCS